MQSLLVQKLRICQSHIETLALLEYVTKDSKIFDQSVSYCPNLRELF